MYALVGCDVMVASFVSVSVVTIGAMVAMVGGMVALVLAGMTQVGGNGNKYSYNLDRSKNNYDSAFWRVHLS